MSLRARPAMAGAPGAPRRLEVARGMAIVWGTLSRGQASGTLRAASGLLRVAHLRRGRCAVVLSDGERIEVAEGDVVLLGAGVDAMGIELCWGPVGGLVLAIDDRRLPADIRHVCSSFDVSLEAIDRMVPAERPVRVVHDNPALSHVLAEAYPLVDEGNIGYLRLKAVELLRCLTTLAGVSPRGRGSARGGSARVRHVRIALRAQQEMTRDVSRPKTIPTLAAICGTSPTVLKEAFRETFGVPIYTWYREYRVRLAADALLESDLSVAEIAASVGYSNPSKFTKAFSDTMGATPREWRAAGGVGPRPADGAADDEPPREAGAGSPEASRQGGRAPAPCALSSIWAGRTF